ncbi:MAG: heme o synthase [Phycisphaerales bacterium]
MARLASGISLSNESAAKPASPIAPLIEATKPGITRLVTITSTVGFLLAAAPKTWSLPELIIAGLSSMAGTALSAAGANAINQWMEADRDALMDRTRNRPLPSGRATPSAILTTGVVLSVVGVLVLALLTNWVAAAISAACVIVYIFIYTPMKPRTTLSTLVGAIPGALPPLIGWVAAAQGSPLAELGRWGGWSLFILMFVWQIPHFLAIAWMYRDDYAKGGYKVLPVVENGERRTASTIIRWTVLLVPATIAPAWLLPVQLGWLYIAIAGVAAGVFCTLAYQLVRGRTRAQARAVFFFSIAHLPLIMGAMVVETLLRIWL